jgi:hypothetical protein
MYYASSIYYWKGPNFSGSLLILASLKIIGDKYDLPKIYDRFYELQKII